MDGELKDGDKDRPGPHGALREYLEKAYAEAMYSRLYVTAGIIAASLETIGVPMNMGDDEDGDVTAPDMARIAQILAFPGGGDR
ncbi:hypothetical protein [Sneathiella chinensis]|uniref:Uncharacterized protein n=1 Tax=Sneathiella chinensis TaxID=349750 RepID=A0ABQ5U6J5_9PROT|nr:hypothetical protein [Sneathiella chinensis]GLQ07523.1 hypothetical protein GCM10007924_27440 [Sneathiella chinensis]